MVMEAKTPYQHQHQRPPTFKPQEKCEGLLYITPLQLQLQAFNQFSKTAALL